MTNAINIVQRFAESQALLQYVAHRLATAPNRAGVTVSDVVILGSVSNAVIEGNLSAVVRASEAANVSEQHEELAGTYSLTDALG